MLGKTKLFMLVVTVSLLLVTAPAMAQTTNCTSAAASEADYTGANYVASSGLTTTVATAANFAGPLGSYLSTYVSNNPTYRVILCSDSTGNLETVINTALNAGQYSPYSLFFAADTTAQQYATDWGYVDFGYATGNDVLFGYTAASGKTKTISSVGDLLSGQTGTSLTVSGGAGTGTGQLGTYTVSSTITGTADSLGIANPLSPNLAPYGIAAYELLNDMQPIQASGNLLPGTVPSWLMPLTTYANVTKIYNAVGTGVKAGFVAKSQICSQIGSGTIAYVDFTNSAFYRDQWAAYFNSNAVGGALYSQIATQLNNGQWATFVTGACYVGVPAS